MERQTPAPALDTNDLMTRCLGKLDFAQRILTHYRERCGQDVADLAQAATMDQRGTVGDLAHRVKGASANAGAPGMRAVAAQIEAIAHEGSAEKILALVAELKTEWNRFTAAAEQFLPSAKTDA